ncbi:MAG: phage Gp37/Gp68 family protein [candidate division Zixibacteria bacterium]|nr:phage Gp37/Gp68 family protein [candidate division Zixibacteria bacterium]
MAAQSRIEWTESTWNPVTGCSKVSPGCDHCYADRMAKRLQGMGVHKYRNGFEVTLHPSELEAPLRWRKPQIIFVNSMSDLFHPQVPFAYVEQIFDVMRRANHHVFQILTKRSKQLVRAADKLDWPPNVWMGVTVESQPYTFRINDLRKTKAAVKFLSLEPLLGPLVNLDLHEIDWAIVGGESGPGARPMDKKWVRDIRRQCREQSVHFFFKQWGGVNKKAAGRTLDGRIYDAMPPLPDPVAALGQSTMFL